jgi:hypothetical protein
MGIRTETHRQVMQEGRSNHHRRAQRRRRVSKGTTHRTVRIEDTLWDAAKTAANERGDNLSDIIRKALQQYVDQHDTHATKLLISPKN